MSTNTLASNRWSISFFVTWVLVTGITLAVGQIGSLLLAWDIGDFIERSMGQGAAILIFGLLVGIGIGGFGAASQAFLLRGQVNAKRWIGGTIVGAVLALSIAMAVIVPAGDSMPNWLSGLLAGAVLGLGAGAGQWIALRGYLSGINRWALASGLSYAVSILLLFSTGGEGREIVALISGGLSFGVISGLGVWWAGLAPSE